MCLSVAVEVQLTPKLLETPAGMMYSTMGHDHQTVGKTAIKTKACLATTRLQDGQNGEDAYMACPGLSLATHLTSALTIASLPPTGQSSMQSGLYHLQQHTPHINTSFTHHHTSPHIITPS
jgi:hypothetical protein